MTDGDGIVRVVLRGTALPGRSVGVLAGRRRDNLHVGIIRSGRVVRLVPGDAPVARWRIRLVVATDASDDRRLDLRGTFVAGPQWKRVLRFAWVDLAAHQKTTECFAGEVQLSDIDSWLCEALITRRSLVARFSFTGSNGTLERQPRAMWSLAKAS